MSSKDPNGPDRGQPPSRQPGSSGYGFGSPTPSVGQTPKPRAPKGPAPKEPRGPAGSGSRRAGATPARRARRSRKSKKRVTIIAAAAAIVLAGGAGAVLATSGSNTVDPAGTTSASSPAQPSAPPATATASDAVSGYLQALASGDANAALTYSAVPVKSGGTLSNAVLAASNKRAKITEINVPAVDDVNATAVDASYKLGSLEVTETFPVAKAADAWKLQQVVATVSLGTIVDAGVPLKINGAAVTSDTVSLFPGSYAVTSGLKTITYGSKNTLLVQRPSDSPASQLKLTATTTGKKVARSAARKTYRACLSQKATAPKGCPFGLTTGGDSKVSESTITWTQNGPDPFKKSTFLLTGRSIGVRISLDVTLKADCTKSGLPATCSGTVKAKRIGYVLSTDPSRDVVWVEP